MSICIGFHTNMTNLHQTNADDSAISLLKRYIESGEIKIKIILKIYRVANNHLQILLIKFDVF